MKLGDKAEQADTEEVRLARDSMGVYRLESDELVDADEIGTDDFPQYGDFAECMTSLGGRNPEWDTEVFVEVPSKLAVQLVELGIEPGDGFRIQSVQKDPSGEWVYTVTEETLAD